ncbi:MAG: HAMP domain-containing histidine kinase [Ignavibacteria bacterium]|nr:HAMP domain-containing histidine kinase [Ignavibacteria bacterium]
MATYYLPAETFPIEKVLEQKSKIEKPEIFKEIIEKIPYPILVLNSLRQIVFYNEALIESFPDIRNNQLLGARPGEVFRCENSTIEEGCGTTIFCRTCGAAKAIATSLAGRDDIQECRITTIEDEAYDFRVWTYPKIIDGEKYSIFTLIDISHEKRRQILERIFYHDILNTANGIIGLLELYMPSEGDQENLIKTSYSFAKILADEINSQRLITLAEAGELDIETSKFSINELINEIITLYSSQLSFKDINIQINIPEDFHIISDKTLLRRIVINLLKNALEASQTGSIIRITAHKTNNLNVVKVYNQAVMPEEVKLQVFKRSFSTKGKGRGLGTYSIKLLTEKFLKGKASFISEKDYGTEFTIEIPDLI